MSKFTPSSYMINSSMMSLFSQLFPILVDLQMYSLCFLYENLIAF